MTNKLKARLSFFALAILFAFVFGLVLISAPVAASANAWTVEGECDSSDSTLWIHPLKQVWGEPSNPFPILIEVQHDGHKYDFSDPDLDEFSYPIVENSVDFDGDDIHVWNAGSKQYAAKTLLLWASHDTESLNVFDVYKSFWQGTDPDFDEAPLAAPPTEAGVYTMVLHIGQNTSAESFEPLAALVIRVGDAPASAVVLSAACADDCFESEWAKWDLPTPRDEETGVSVVWKYLEGEHAAGSSEGQPLLSTSSDKQNFLPGQTYTVWPELSGENLENYEMQISYKGGYLDVDNPAYFNLKKIAVEKAFAASDFAGAVYETSAFAAYGKDDWFNALKPTGVGEIDAALTWCFDDPQTGDPVFYTTAADANTYRLYLTVTGEDSDCFDWSGITYPDDEHWAEVTVAKCPLTVTPQNCEIVYGSASAYGYAITGIPEAVSGADQAKKLSTLRTDGAVAGEPIISSEYDVGNAEKRKAGNYEIAASIGTLSSSNYEFDFKAKGTLTVAPKPITVTIADVNVTYGDAFAGYEESNTGVAYEEEVYTLDVYAVQEGVRTPVTVATDTSVGTYYIIGQKINDNYDLTWATEHTVTVGEDHGVKAAAYVIGKAPLTVTPDKGQSKKKGEVDPTFTYAVSGAKNGETPVFSGKLSREEGEATGEYALLIGTLALSADAVNDNYSLAFTEGVKFTVARGTIDMESITFAGAEAPYSGDQRTLAVSGDLPDGVSVAYYLTDKDHAPTETPFGTKTDVGTYYAEARFSVENEEYETPASMYAVLVIQPREVEVSWSPASPYVYSGAAQDFPLASASYTLSDGKETLHQVTLSVAITSAQTEFKRAGEYVFTATCLESNYTLKESTVTCEVTMNKKSLTVDWENEKEYCGSANPPEATISGYAEGDEVSAVCGQSPSKVGAYSNLTFRLEGADAENYECASYAIPTYTIAPRTLSFAWEEKEGDVYEYTFDGAYRLPVVTISNAVAGEEVNFVWAQGYGAIRNVTVEAQKVAIDSALVGKDAANYRMPDVEDGVTYAFVKILPLALEIEWSDTTQTYDGKRLLPTATIKNAKTDGKMTDATEDDLVDEVAIAFKPVTEGGVESIGKGVYQFEFEQLSLVGKDAANYLLKSTEAVTLTVEARRVEVKFDGKTTTITYGDKNAWTAYMQSVAENGNGFVRVVTTVGDEEVNGLAEGDELSDLVKVVLRDSAGKEVTLAETLPVGIYTWVAVNQNAPDYLITNNLGEASLEMQEEEVFLFGESAQLLVARAPILFSVTAEDVVYGTSFKVPALGDGIVVEETTWKFEGDKGLLTAQNAKEHVKILYASIDKNATEAEVAALLKDAEAWSESVPDAAGRYAIRVALFGIDNYESAQCVVTFEIANADFVSVSVTPAAWTYDKTEHASIASAAAVTVKEQTATFLYSTQKDGAYGAALPTFVNAGNHTVYWKVSAPNHNEACGNVSVTVSKKSITVTALNQESDQGEALLPLTVAEDSLTVGENGKVYALGGDLVATLATEAKGSVAGEYAITVTVASNDNYEVRGVNATYTVKAKADPTEPTKEEDPSEPTEPTDPTQEEQEPSDKDTEPTQEQEPSEEESTTKVETLSAEEIKQATESGEGVSIKAQLEEVKALIDAQPEGKVESITFVIGEETEEAETPAPSITFDLEAIKQLTENAEVKITYKETQAKDLDRTNETFKNAQLVIEVGLGGAKFDSGKATVTTAFENKAPSGKKAVVYYVDDNGKKTDMNAKFANGKVTFETTHFSTYVVEYVSVESKAGLSAGAVAGIVIGCVAGALAIAACTFLLLKKKGGKKNEQPTKEEQAAQETPTTQEEQEKK